MNGGRPLERVERQHPRLKRVGSQVLVGVTILVLGLIPAGCHRLR